MTIELVFHGNFPHWTLAPVPSRHGVAPLKNAGYGAATGSTSPTSTAVAPAGEVRRVDGHQFQRPSSATVAGTRSVRTRNVSMRMPIARPKPTSRT
jgi:hypothetical protein